MKKKSATKTRKYNSVYSSYYKKSRDINEIIEKRYNILIGVITILIFILFFRLFYIQIIKENHYKSALLKLTGKVTEGVSAPRGRIYDRNHNVLVDNKPVKIIYYQKPEKINTTEEIKIAYLLSDLIELNIENLNDYDLRNFWLKNNPKLGNSKIKDVEWEAYEQRKLTNDDILELKLERITDSELSKYDDKDKLAAYVYYLMNKGYYYNEKIIKKDNITDVEYALVAENIDDLKGIGVRLDWEREYPYNDVFKTILGNVSTSEMGIPYELKEEYLKKGYALNDRVGISFLELQYEGYLKGVKSKYEVINNNQKRLLEEGKKGNDIVLTIDIELQKAIEEILIQKLYETKSTPNTEYYNRSFVVVTDPNNGDILAMAGKQIIEKNGQYVVYDYTPGIVTSPVVVGSVVKGASNIVAYNNNVLSINEYKDDRCIKIASTKEKCSWKYLGYINDIDSLKFSSNVYQYDNAIKIGKGTYKYNEPIKIDTKAFDIYRNTFAEFGLGVETKIDLPVESLGYKGKSTLPGHLLDFAIGQYDSYTPIQLSQYITTIANGGNRYKLNLLDKVYEGNSNLTETIFDNELKILNKVNTDDKYMDRIKEGFKAVMNTGGTGNGYVSLEYNPAGKTGTSQSFIDTNEDGIVDTETLTHTFISYFPADNPKFALTVISPDVYHYGNNNSYVSPVNKKIAQEVSKKIFDFYR